MDSRRLAVFSLVTSAISLDLALLACASELGPVNPLATLTPSPTPTAHSYTPRDDATTTSTIAVTTTDLLPVDSTETTSTPPPTTSALPPLTAVSTVNIPATIGMVMPDPYQSAYVGLNYTFGFVDAVSRPAPTYGGWIRAVRPLLVFPDYTVNVFPESGTEDPTSAAAMPYGGGGLCGETVEDYSISYPYQFVSPGWYMFVLNQTYIQPTITNKTCAYPLVSVRSFFSTQTISLAPYPTVSPGPADPTSAYTLFAAVKTDTPGSLPIDPEPTSDKQKLAVGLGVAGGVIALVLMGFTMLFVRKKRRMEAEALAFARLRPEEQAAFLAENPESWLNPANQVGQGSRGYGYGYGYGNHGWWSKRWGSGPGYGLAGRRGGDGGAGLYAYPGFADKAGSRGYAGGVGGGSERLPRVGHEGWRR